MIDLIRDDIWKDKFDEHFFKNITEIIFKKLKLRETDFSIHLVDSKKIRELNYKYLGKDKTTNVLSIETKDPFLLGDIFISYETVKSEAIALNINLEDHLSLLFTHGLLHLLGYSHDKVIDNITMRHIENKILRNLKIDNDHYEKKYTYFNGAKNIILYTSLFCTGLFGVFIYSPYSYPILLLPIFFLLWFLLEKIRNNNLYSLYRTPKRKFFLTGLCLGAGFYSSQFSWLTESFLVQVPGQPPYYYLVLPVLILIGLLFGSILGLSSLSFSRGRSLAQRLLLFAVIFTSLEWLRSWIFTGFPWNPLSVSLIELRHIQLVSVFSSLGLTFLLLLWLGLLFIGIYRRRVKIILLSLLILSFSWGFGNYRLSSEQKLTDISVRIVQPSLSNYEKWDYKNADKNLGLQKKLSRLPTKDGTGIDILIWSESSFPYTIPIFDIKTKTIIDEPTPILFGAVGSLKNSEKLYNGLFISDRNLSRESLHQISVKHHLVPFGEYAPLSSVIPWKTVLPLPSEFSSGAIPSIQTILIKRSGISFLPLICYEMIFSDLIPRNKKFDFILTLTNDSWFGIKTGPYQHDAIARMYAIQFGVPVIRSSYSGISSIIDGLGRRVPGVVKSFQNPIGYKSDYIRLNERGVLDSYIPEPRGGNFAGKFSLSQWMIMILLFSIFVNYKVAKLNDRNRR
ncbi:MAG: apolipoprotein N-acyltransferase [Alphaproteobacteria bacterium]|nr:apolipoprotein N-acyltransferase [Alphaproteobacteria bacterium]MBL0717954.1 apolipoprotein N-acyltransferase [Alphaproteobacteria bacterium]